jgi:hypothetical protein
LILRHCHSYANPLSLVDLDATRADAPVVPRLASVPKEEQLAPHLKGPSEGWSFRVPGEREGRKRVPNMGLGERQSTLGDRNHMVLMREQPRHPLGTDAGKNG